MKTSFFVWLYFFSSFVFSQALYEHIATYQADLASLQRKYTLKYSPEYFTRLDRFYADQLVILANMDFENLDKTSQIDYVLLRNLIEKNRYFLSLDKKSVDEVVFVLAHTKALQDFVIERRYGAIPDAQKVAALMDHMTKNTQQLQVSLATTGKKFTSWQQAELASEMVKNLSDQLKETHEFYLGYDISYTWWVAKPYEQLQKSLAEYGSFLKEFYVNSSIKDDGSGIIGKPIGRDALIKSLQFEFIPYSPEELIKLAEKEFAWCEQEMLKASKELGYGDNWKGALEHVKNTYVPPGQWPSDIKKLADEAIEFVTTRDLITVPDLAIETWRMTMMSPERQLVSPFFLGGEQIIISYPTNTMDHDAKMMSMRGNNPYFSLATVQHELIPGHHLQQFMNQRYKPYRRPFYTPFWTEGWALYWEFNLWDKGFPVKPEEKIGMLFWRMHRCARIIFSLNYHLNKMTPQQCIDLLVDKVGHERANAEAEVRRSFTGNYGPLYQIAYMVGGLQFYALRKEFADSGKMTEKDFHDFVMQQNNVPIELIMLTLSGQAITRDYRTTWKFYK